MTEQHQEKNDATLVRELLRNERIVQHPTFGAVKLRRLTAEQEALVAEERRKRNHALMRDRDVLSRAELEKIAIERGMWSPDMEKRHKELSFRMGEAMGILDVVGFKSVDELSKSYQESVETIAAMFGEDTEARDAVHRYFNLADKPNGKDRMLIHDRATSSDIDDLMTAAEAQRTQIDLWIELSKMSEELDELTKKQVRLFVDSIESQTDRAEEMARIYYGAVSAETEKPLWPSIADMMKAPPGDVEFLVVEMQYFLHGVTDEFREKLGKYGFIRRLPVTDDSSAGSRGQPQSSSGGESAGSEPTSSSEVTESSVAS